jgi:cytochrome c oxidase subunit 3
LAIFSGILRRSLWRNRDVGAILSSRSWEDCIVNTSGFDFRYGQVYRWAYDYSVPGAEQDFVAQNQPTGRTRRLGKRAVSITILFLLAPIGAIIAWWLSRQRLMSKPWLEVGAIDDFPRTGALPLPAATVGLGVFLAVVSSLFALFISAYFMRMQVADWIQMPAPKLLWFNTGVLILSSVALQYAQVAARRGRMEDVVHGLIAGGFFAYTFLVGQLFAWQQLKAAGYFLAANPANAFFYLLTGLHGLHLLGGLVALVLTIDKLFRGCELGQVRLSVKLCAVYWHYLLLLWLVLFTLLTPWVGDFAAFCRSFSFPVY